jgi:hypothetical protein
MLKCVHYKKKSPHENDILELVYKRINWNHIIDYIESKDCDGVTIEFDFLFKRPGETLGNQSFNDDFLVLESIPASSVCKRQLVDELISYIGSIIDRRDGSVLYDIVKDEIIVTLNTHGRYKIPWKDLPIYLKIPD